MRVFRSGRDGTPSAADSQPTCNDLAIDDKTIQAILRHSDVSVAERCYIKTLPQQSIAAMNALESALCAERALGAAVS